MGEMDGSAANMVFMHEILQNIIFKKKILYEFVNRNGSGSNTLLKRGDRVRQVGKGKKGG